MPARFSQYFPALSVSCPFVLPVMDFPHWYQMVCKVQIQQFSDQALEELSTAFTYSPRSLGSRKRCVIWPHSLCNLSSYQFSTPAKPVFSKVLFHTSMFLQVLFLSMLHKFQISSTTWVTVSLLASTASSSRLSPLLRAPPGP